MYFLKYRVDADGAPNAYGGPDKKGLDDDDNARLYPGGPFDPKIIAFEDGKQEPYVQGPDEPSPGSYVAMTSFQDSFYPKKTDIRRYVDAETYPYIVRNKEMEAAGVRFGDIATVYNRETGRYQHAIVTEQGPKDKPGEISIRLAKDLGLASNPRNSGSNEKSFAYIVYPQSRSEPVQLRDENGVITRTSTFIPSPDSVRARGEALFKAIGNTAFQKALPNAPHNQGS